MSEQLPLETRVTEVLNQLWHRHEPNTSDFCDAILDLFQMKDRAFKVNAYAYKGMKDQLVSYIVEHGSVAQ